MNTDSKEFTEILNRVPKWHYLTPGEVLKEGDEYQIAQPNHWRPANYAECVRLNALLVTRTARRPIPETVRRSMAWWALYNSLATVTPEQHGWVILAYKEGSKIVLDVSGEVTTKDSLISITFRNYCNGLRKFSSVVQANIAIPILGGESEIIKHLSTGDGAYMRWVMEEE